MATVTKDFRIKSGLVVEGATGTINGSDIITEDAITGGTQTNIAVTYVDGVVNFVAENGVLDATTDQLDEGSTNLYFTDARAKTSAANLLTSASLSNITITGDGSGLTITAENGVADSTTDDLDEGTTNKYFTNQRALDATASAYDSAGSALTAETNSNTYTDGLIGDVTVDGTTGNTVTDRIDSAQADAEGYANGLAANYDPAGTGAAEADSALADANDYTDLLVGDATVDGTAGNTVTDRIATAQTAAENYADSLAADYEPSGSVEDHALLTTTHGVTGTLVGTSDSQTLTNKTMGDDLLMDGNQISGLGTPTQADHAATKSYVDAVSEGLNVHQAARVATTANVAIATELEAGDIVDGVTLVAGDRVLVKSQTTISQNGIYVVQSSGAATRALDFDTAIEVVAGDFVFVSLGTVNGSTGYVQTSSPATIGTDDITFTQFSGAGTYLAGNGLNLTGSTFSIDTSITVDQNTSQTLTSKTIDASSNTLSNIANASLVNDSVTISGTEVALGESINLDTADVAEDASNLYFTDVRAVTALEAVVPDFTAVEINSVAKQVAATSSSLGSVVVTAFSFAKAAYRTAKFIVKIDNGTHNEVTEVLLSLDSSDNIAITEYAIVATNGSRGTITADISGTDVRLRVDPVNDSTITAVGTLIA